MPNSDLISRKAAIRAVHEEFDECLVWDESGETTANAVESVLHLVQSVDAAPVEDGWISVKDRLPKLGKTVLFTGKSIYGTRFITQRGWYDGTFWHRDAGETLYSSTPVTHWMPLPEPPKEDE